MPSKLKFGIFVPNGNIVDSTSIKTSYLLNYKSKSGLIDCQLISKLQAINKKLFKMDETQSFIFYN